MFALNLRRVPGCVSAALTPPHRSIVGFKATAGFKATDKSGGNNAIAAIKNLGANLVNAMHGNAANGTLPITQPPLAAAAAAAAAPKPPVAPPKVIIGHNGQRIVQRPMTQAEVMQVCEERGRRSETALLMHPSFENPPIFESVSCVGG